MTACVILPTNKTKFFLVICEICRNEDIRDAILSVVHMMRSTEDKLERHEYRERALGEHLKKMLVTLDKRIKLLDPVKGTISRLDERLAGVETILLANDERDKNQIEKTQELTEEIKKNLPVVMDKLKADIINEVANKVVIPEIAPAPIIPAVMKEDINGVEKSILSKIEDLSSTIQKLQKDLLNLKDEHESAQKINKQANEHMEKVKSHLNSNEELLEKYETKLAEYNNKIEVIPQNDKAENDWHTSIMQALEKQKTDVEVVLAEVRTISGKVNSLPEKTDLATSQNQTLKSLEILQKGLDKNAIDTKDFIKDKMETILKQTQEAQLDNSISSKNISDQIKILTGHLADSHQALTDEVRTLAKLEQVMVQTADGVMDTKRRVEYGVHQILLEIGDLVKVHSKEVNATINERFDTFELSILDEENGALANLTSKIGDEIDQVWRQIGIMHQQMRDSTDTLNKLQNQTDAYVNGSLNVMDSMKGKVVKITDRMIEVDDNLNYLMGKLSLVTQEFNLIKTGLGKALDEIRQSFQEVQNKVKDNGPGPHEIEVSNEVNVNHEEIRDVILMLVRVMSATEDKLRRHEFRERAVSDVIRKTLINIDKRMKTLHPVMGTAERLDERISDVEKTLLANDIKDNNQLADIKNVLEDILKNFPILIEKMKNEIIKEVKTDIGTAVDVLNETSESEEDETDDGEEETTLENKIDNLSSSIKQIQQELTKLKKEQQNTQKLNSKFNEYIDRFEVLLTNNENLLKKYEDKLGGGEVLPQDDTQTGWQGSIIQALERTENDVEGVLKEVKNTHTQTVDLIRNLETKMTESLNNSRNYIEQKLQIGDPPILEPVIPDNEDINVKLDLISLSIEDASEKLSLVNYKEIGETLGRIKSHLNDTKNLFGRYETKLSEYGDKLESISINNKCNHTKHDQEILILQALEKQNDNINTSLNEIQTKLGQDLSINSNEDIQNRTLNLLRNLDDSLTENADRSKNLLQRVESILMNEEQMLDFSRKSASDIVDKIETLQINHELSLNDITEKLDNIESKL
ncbi:hypothetical protein MML48_8g00015373 [Holotrichia oblita]|uniref:Uncharacterized protein n=1 Tax=Holotrichia oblita TaxID=644536 RepID=A0ACB9SU51_HOLOL|nr:hypothetical protein MML48_8g00015373 [Holotrichia oblita]